MKAFLSSLGKGFAWGLGAVVLLMAGCATTDQNGTTGQAPGFATHYRSTDGRHVDIGPSTPGNDGLVFKEPHMDRC